MFATGDDGLALGCRLLELWEKVLPETNHSAVTDHCVWFKTTKWAFEDLVSFEVKKSSKSIPSLAQLFYEEQCCLLGASQIA